MRFLQALVGALCLISCPATAAWYEAKSRHFAIYSDDSPAALSAFAAELEKFDKAVRMVRGMDDPPVGNGGRVTIYVLRDETSVSRVAVGKASPIAGFYIPRASGSVAFVPRRTEGDEEWDMHAETVFFHEYAHHLMFQNTDAALPSWLVEGFAEFFSTAKFDRDGSVRLGMPADHRADGLFLLDPAPIQTILTGTARLDATGEDMERFYGRSWLLTHYLTFDPNRQGQLAKYVGEIKSGTDLLGAAQDAFGDLRKLDKDLDHYLAVNRFKYLSLKNPAFNNVPVEMRPLRPGEVAIMPIRIRSDRGVDGKTAPQVAGLARGVAASYPDDPAVQRELAEAEFDAGNYAQAEKAAERALALEPHLVKALIYKGRAEMELAKSTPNTDWNAIRGLFLAANKLDTEDPEPLLYYYESFGMAGVRPSQNAVDGLEYAMVLAPQDQGVRMMAVAELINASKFAEARDALAPLAFDPHSNELQGIARKIMDALKSNDQKSAMAALEAGAGETQASSK